MGQRVSALRLWGRPHHAKQCQEKRPEGQLQAKQHGGDGSNGKAHDPPAGKRAGNAILAFLEVSRRLNDEQLEEAIDQAEHNAVPLDALPELIQQLEEKMKVAAKNLEFEEAANLRDRIKGLLQKLVWKA